MCKSFLVRLGASTYYRVIQRFALVAACNWVWHINICCCHRIVSLKYQDEHFEVKKFVGEFRPKEFIFCMIKNAGLWSLYSFWCGRPAYGVYILYDEEGWPTGFIFFLIKKAGLWGLYYLDDEGRPTEFIFFMTRKAGLRSLYSLWLGRPAYGVYTLYDEKCRQKEFIFFMMK